MTSSPGTVSPHLWVQVSKLYDSNKLDAALVAALKLLSNVRDDLKTYGANDRNYIDAASACLFVVKIYFRTIEQGTVTVQESSDKILEYLGYTDVFLKKLSPHANQTLATRAKFRSKYRRALFEYLREDYNQAEKLLKELKLFLSQGQFFRGINQFLYSVRTYFLLENILFHKTMKLFTTKPESKACGDLLESTGLSCKAVITFSDAILGDAREIKKRANLERINARSYEKLLKVQAIRFEDASVIKIINQLKKLHSENRVLPRTITLLKEVNPYLDNTDVVIRSKIITPIRETYDCEDTPLDVFKLSMRFI